MKFRKRVEMSCLLLAVVVAAISSSRSYTDVSPSSKSADETSLLLQKLLPSRPEQTLKVGDSREKAIELLGRQHYSQYISCGILNADYWYLPDGNVLSIDTGEEGETIYSLYIAPLGAASMGTRIEVWNLSSPGERNALKPWLTAVRAIAPIVEEQRDIAGGLVSSCRQR